MAFPFIFEGFQKITCIAPYRLNTTKSSCSLFHIKSTHFITVFRHFLAYQIFRDLYSHKELDRYFRKTKRKGGVNFYIRKLQFVKYNPLNLLLFASFNFSFRDIKFLRRHFYLACDRNMPISLECKVIHTETRQGKSKHVAAEKMHQERKKDQYYLYLDYL